MPKGSPHRDCGSTAAVALEDGLANIDLTGRSSALRAEITGGINLKRNELDAMRIETVVINPAALAANLRAQDLELKVLLNGKFSELRYQYLLTAPQLALGQSLFMGLQAEGEGQRDAGGWDIPVELSVNELIGNGSLARRLASGFDATSQSAVRTGATIF